MSHNVFICVWFYPVTRSIYFTNSKEDGNVFPYKIICPANTSFPGGKNRKKGKALFIYIYLLKKYFMSTYHLQGHTNYCVLNANMNIHFLS